MRQPAILLILIIPLNFSFLEAQSLNKLRIEINKILADKDATIGVAISGVNAGDILSINGDRHLPMQSIFKYHLAVAVLSKVDQGEFSLNDSIPITKKDLDNNLYSPIRKDHSAGTVLTLAEILKYTVASSDNVGCDVLFELIGGPMVVEQYLHKAGIRAIAIKYNELVQQSKWEFQYKNWTTAKAANQALRVFYENSKQQLSGKSHQFLWDTMKSTWTGKNAIKGKLPREAVVAHKTGHSGKNENGLTGAQNDIGIVFLPNGGHYYISVLISDSQEENSVNEDIIADIARLAWDYFKN